MAKIIELIGEKNRWAISSLGARIVNWEGKDGEAWRRICRGDGNKKASDDAHRAAVMFPWANRIGGGHWSLEGTRVPVNTKKHRGNLHGLTFDAEWTVLEETPKRAAFRTILEPCEFYPKRVECTVTYELSVMSGREGLEVKIEPMNPEGETGIAYVTTGIHPYFLNPFGAKIDEMELSVAAAREFAADGDLIPTGLVDVAAQRDFRDQRRIDETAFDNGFVIDGSHSPVAALSIRNFRLAIHALDNCDTMQVYIPPHREEIALEPQAGGADAFRFHQFGLRRLSPGTGFKVRMVLAAEFA